MLSHWNQFYFLIFYFFIVVLVIPISPLLLYPAPFLKTTPSPLSLSMDPLYNFSNFLKKKIMFQATAAEVQAISQFVFVVRTYETINFAAAACNAQNMRSWACIHWSNRRQYNIWEINRGWTFIKWISLYGEMNG